jgi:hypothetical protein
VWCAGRLKGKEKQGRTSGKCPVSIKRETL